MGLGGISIWQLLIILVIVVMIFGTKRLKNLGSDLGGAVKGFKESMNPDDDEADNGETKKVSAETTVENDDAATAAKSEDKSSSS